MTTNDQLQKIADAITTRLEEAAARWIKEDEIDPGAIAAALVTVAGDISIKYRGKEKTCEWLHEHASTIESMRPKGATIN